MPAGKITPPKMKMNRPEAKVQADLIKYLTARNWFVNETHGNWFQSGFPDLYATHPIHGQRWIEVKDPLRKGNRSLFTPAQQEKFPRWACHRIGIWVLKGATESEYGKLFNPPNWMVYLR